MVVNGGGGASATVEPRQNGVCEQMVGNPTLQSTILSAADGEVVKAGQAVGLTDAAGQKDPFGHTDGAAPGAP